MVTKLARIGLGAVMTGALMLCWASSASASLLGQQITHTWIFGSQPTSVFSVDPYVVGPTAEVSCPGTANLCVGFVSAPGTQFVDVGDATISFSTAAAGSFFGGTVFNDWEWTDLIWSNGPGKIDDVLLMTDIDGLDLSRVSFTDNSVRIILGGLSWGAGEGNFTLTLETDHTVVLPEPSALAILGLGLFGLGLMRPGKTV